MAPDGQDDPWNSGRLEKRKIDPAADTEEWLGEASAEDVERARAKPVDVYADKGPSVERPVTRITHIQVERGDKSIYRIMAIGFALLLGSTFVQVLRAESLERPPIVTAQASPTPVASATPMERTAVKTEAPKWDIPERPVGIPELPTLIGTKAQCQAGERIKINIEIENRGNAPSKSAKIKIDLKPQGSRPVKISGPLPSLAPGQQAAFDVETPFEMKVPYSSENGQFRTQEGVVVKYDIKIEEAK